MMVDDPFKRSTLGSSIFYRNPRAALIWLEKAFGFEPSMVVSDADDRLVHSEMRFGDGYMIVDSEWADHVASPASVAGKNTQSVYVRLKDGLRREPRSSRSRLTSFTVNGSTGRAILKVTSGHFPRPYALFHARRLNGWAICRLKAGTD